MYGSIANFTIMFIHNSLRLEYLTYMDRAICGARRLTGGKVVQFMVLFYFSSF